MAAKQAAQVRIRIRLIQQNILENWFGESVHENLGQYSINEAINQIVASE